IDYRIEYDIAMLYNKIGNKAKFEELSNDIIVRAEEELKSNPDISQNYYNPYRILLDVYEAKGEYQKALELLNRLSAMSPNDPNVKQKMESIKQKMNNPSGK
ncbi:MAG: tetratricopeptide repeat protein, partial [bacterium]